MYKNDEFDFILSLVCDVFDVSMEELLSKRRAEWVVDARCALCHILCFQGLSLSAVGRLIGITPAGVSCLLDRYEDRVMQNLFFSNCVDTIRERVIASSKFAVRMNQNGTITIVNGK